MALIFDSVKKQLEDWVLANKNDRSYSCGHSDESQNTLKIVLAQKFRYDNLDYQRLVSRSCTTPTNSENEALSVLKSCIEDIDTAINKATDFKIQFEKSMEPVRRIEALKLPRYKKQQEAMELLDTIKQLQRFPYYSAEVEELRQAVKDAEKKVDLELQVMNQAVRNRLDLILGIK